MVTGDTNSVAPRFLSHPSPSQALTQGDLALVRSGSSAWNLGCGNYFEISMENNLEFEAGPSSAIGVKVMSWRE